MSSGVRDAGFLVQEQYSPRPKYPVFQKNKEHNTSHEYKKTVLPGCALWMGSQIGPTDKHSLWGHIMGR